MRSYHLFLTPKKDFPQVFVTTLFTERTLFAISIPDILIIRIWIVNKPLTKITSTFAITFLTKWTLVSNPQGTLTSLCWFIAFDTNLPGTSGIDSCMASRIHNIPYKAGHNYNHPWMFPAKSINHLHTFYIQHTGEYHNTVYKMALV